MSVQASGIKGRGIKGIVTGKVQGVWFRKFTQEQAESRDVTGYAKNKSDGSVEILLCGESDDVAAVQVQVVVGPPGSMVETVDWSYSDQMGGDKFYTC